MKLRLLATALSVLSVTLMTCIAPPTTSEDQGIQNTDQSMTKNTGLIHKEANIKLVEDSKNKEKISKKDLRIIGRLTAGIIRDRHGQWWECGKLITDKEKTQNKAMLYAYKIVHISSKVSSNSSGFILNPWGLAGTIRNESQFDRCALGYFVRKRAYKIGLLKKRRRCISHTEEEILSVVQSRKVQNYFKRSGFDLGTAQLLSRFYPDPKDFKTMLSIHGSIIAAAYHMKEIGEDYKTSRPWLYWRGYRCDWYDRKITRRARQLGATHEEI